MKNDNLRKLRVFFALAWKISPAYIFLLIGSSLSGSLLTLSNVVLPKYLIDELTGAMDARRLVLFGGLIVTANLFFAFLTKVFNRLMRVKNRYVNEQMTRAMSEKIMNVPFSYLEDPYYLDLKNRALFAGVNMDAMSNLITNLAQAVQSFITAAGLLALMFTLSPWLVLALVAIIGLSLLCYRFFMKYQVVFFQNLIPINRKLNYYFSLCFENFPQKDIRLYDAAPMLIDRVNQYNFEINRSFREYDRRKALYMGFDSILNDLQAAVAYGLVGFRVISDKLGGRIGLGSFTMYTASAVSFSATVIKLGTSIVGIGQMLDYLTPFLEFVSLPDEEQLCGDTVFTGPIESIVFDHVTFRYPKCDRDVLDGVSFTVRGGEKVSIVGLNGAGKTTIVKLICRLYQPTAGHILINGHDIGDYEQESYRKAIAAVFQDYRLFAFSIRENVTCETETDDTRLRQLLQQVGLGEKIAALPQGLDSCFGKQYSEDGIEMSGGEGQKIAIARALYKNSPLIILDEPTSALDPLAEADIYENFNALTGGNTALYISHRMSSSVFCDRILVLDGGRVADFDTHANLMKKTGSLYYKLFDSQAENYRLD